MTDADATAEATTIPKTTHERPRSPRADALRNRAALLAAAREVFRREGLATQMDAIAAEAGLGVGTLYRHFPTKEDLITVLVREGLAQLVASADAATRADDSWDGLAGLVWELAAFEAEDRGMADILAQSATQPADAGPALAAFMTSFETVVTRAQGAGKMRSDVSAEDVVTTICGIGKMMAPDRHSDAGRWQRLIRVFLDGLRKTAAHPS